MLTFFSFQLDSFSKLKEFLQQVTIIKFIIPIIIFTFIVIP